MSEEQNEQNIPVPVPLSSVNNAQNIPPARPGKIKGWHIILIVFLFFVIGGYFVWQNYTNHKTDLSAVPTAVNS
jgi:hypothetical protein